MDPELLLENWLYFLQLLGGFCSFEAEESTVKVWEVMFSVGNRDRGKAVCTTRENAPKGRKQILPVGDKKIDAQYRLVGAIFWRNGDLY